MISPPFFLDNDQYLHENALGEVVFSRQTWVLLGQGNIGKLRRLENWKIVNPIVEVLDSLMVQLEIWEH